MNNEKYIKIPVNILNIPKIPASAVILYGNIALMCNQYGYCYATNSFFAKQLRVSNRTITRLIRYLKDNNVINVDYSDRNIRKIFVSE